MTHEPKAPHHVPQAPLPNNDWAGSLLHFPEQVGDSISNSLDLGGFRQRHLVFNRLERPGQVHVYQAECPAGARLRVQLLTPVLSRGRALAPGVAIVAQGLPYHAANPGLPIKLPAGYSVAAAGPPERLVSPLQDRLSRAVYYPGPVIDTRTLVGGRCYIVVWSPQNNMGKYILRVGHTFPGMPQAWLNTPKAWWQIRGWFGLSRMAAYLVAAGLLLLLPLLRALVARNAWRRKRAHGSVSDGDGPGG